MGDIILNFGKYRGKRLTEIPNAYLGWLTMWDCASICCEDSDCEGECGNVEKVRRFTRTKCSSWCSDPDYVCDCSRCTSLAFLQKQTDIVAAARRLVTTKRLCCHCWTVMPSVGNDRSNGKPHLDWSSRFLHKKCWQQLY